MNGTQAIDPSADACQQDFFETQQHEAIAAASIPRGRHSSPVPDHLSTGSMMHETQVDPPDHHACKQEFETQPHEATAIASIPLGRRSPVPDRLPTSSMPTSSMMQETQVDPPPDHDCKQELDKQQEGMPPAASLPSPPPRGPHFPPPVLFEYPLKRGDQPQETIDSARTPPIPDCATSTDDPLYWAQLFYV